MRFPPSFLDEIRQRLPASDVIRRYIPLQKKGREFSGLCPFHKEKTPSFTVNDDKQFYHCFGCGAHGSIFDFVVEQDNIGFVEAVEKLAAQAGLPLPQLSPQDQEKADRDAAERKSYFDVLEAICQFYEASLYAPPAAMVRDYLKARGLTKTQAQKFRLGYAPTGRDALKNHLAAKAISPQAMLESGVFAHTDSGEIYDRFKGRLIFPIDDIRGRTIAFGGRILDQKSKAAKYVNSPETDLFYKGRMVYNLKKARMSKSPYVVVCEGYMDAISLDHVGLPQAVAPLGTALTASQITLLWQTFDQIILCFDADQAGVRATARAIETALPLLQAGKEIRFMVLPNGEDPDSYVRRQGRAAFETLVQAAQPLHEKIVALEWQQRPVTSPETRLDFYRRLKQATQKISDTTLAEFYYESLKEAASVLLKTSSKRSTKAGGQPASGPFAPASAARSGCSHTAAMEKALLASLITHPQMLDRLWETLASLPLSNSKLDEIRQKLVNAHLEQNKAPASVLTTAETELLQNKSIVRLFPACRAKTPLNEVLSWWQESANQLLQAKGKSQGRRADPLGDASLEQWWDENAARLQTSTGDS